MAKESKILIIDDDNNNLTFLSELLGKEFELATAENGFEGLAIAETFKPELILLDVMMPEMDGYEVCKALRAHADLASTKVLFLSAAVQMKKKLKGYQVGGDDYICKPFNVEEIIAKIKVFMRLKYEEEIVKPGETAPNEKLLGPLYKIKKDLPNLFYVCAESPYCHVYSDSEKSGVYKLRISIQALEEYFKEKDLLRVHRSYMVNPKKIMSITKLKNNEHKILLIKQNAYVKNPFIAIGRKYHDNVKTALPKLFPS